MRDVLTVINGILFANSLSQALSQGLPHVLQKHLDALTRAVTQQLTPGVDCSIEGGSSNTQLQGQVRGKALVAAVGRDVVGCDGEGVVGRCLGPSLRRPCNSVTTCQQQDCSRQDAMNLTLCMHALCSVQLLQP
jgi:hypothetical protein